MAGINAVSPGKTLFFDGCQNQSGRYYYHAYYLYQGNCFVKQPNCFKACQHGNGVAKHRCFRRANSRNSSIPAKKSSN